MNLLLKNAKVYSPIYLGIKDILILDDKIAKIEENINCDYEVIDCSEKIICPMFVDGHEHLEFSDYYDCNDIVQSGVGTVVGCLANEQTEQDVKNLVEITKNINEANIGLKAYCLAGSKNYVFDATKWIKEYDFVVGKKTALFCNERPKPNLSYEKLKQDAISTFNAVKQTNKTLQIHIHLDHPFGRGEKPDIERINSDAKIGNLFWIDKIVEETGVPYSLFKLTHAQKYYNKILEYANKGCFIDYTAFSGEYDDRFDSLVDAIKNKKVDIDKISISSDLGILNLEKNAKSKESPITLLNTLQKLVLEKQVNFGVAIKFLTTNALAPIIKYEELINVGENAKILILDKKLQINKIINL